MSTNTAAQDPDDLEALFDSILAANSAEANPAVVVAEILPPAPPAKQVQSPATSGNEGDSSKVINKIGHMARTLHDTLRELGLNKQIEKAASSIPDARDRLNYVATLTEQAAVRVLNATEAAQPLVEKMEVEAHRLSGQWQLLFDKKLDVEQFKGLVMQTQGFLYEVPKHAKATNAYLMEIMMAQDFQDLTGQVIKKITAVTKEMEQQLLALLVENAPASVKTDLHAGLLNGPVINPTGRTDIVNSQDQVDDLLESLGF
ncbi:MAG TPA: protein phosphatase CheZ [Gallionella sp.]|nr:protein phosphatase CheZ [Gallionella sp.]